MNGLLHPSNGNKRWVTLHNYIFRAHVWAIGERLLHNKTRLWGGVGEMSSLNSPLSTSRAAKQLALGIQFDGKKVRSQPVTRVTILTRFHLWRARFGNRTWSRRRFTAMWFTVRCLLLIALDSSFSPYRGARLLSGRELWNESDSAVLDQSYVSRYYISIRMKPLKVPLGRRNLTMLHHRLPAERISDEWCTTAD